MEGEETPLEVKAVGGGPSENWQKVEALFVAQFCNAGIPTELYNRALVAKEALHNIFP